MDLEFCRRVCQHILSDNGLNIPIIMPNREAIHVTYHCGSMITLGLKGLQWWLNRESGNSELPSVAPYIPEVIGAKGYEQLWAIALHECAHVLVREVIGHQRSKNGKRIHHGIAFVEMFQYLIQEYPYSMMKGI